MVFQRLVEGYLLRAAQRSDVFAHILIWHLQVSHFNNYITKCFFFLFCFCNFFFACPFCFSASIIMFSLTGWGIRTRIRKRGWLWKGKYPRTSLLDTTGYMDTIKNSVAIYTCFLNNSQRCPELRCICTNANFLKNIFNSCQTHNPIFLLLHNCSMKKIDLSSLFKSYTQYLYLYISQSFQHSSFLALLPLVKERIIDSFSAKALDLYKREFEFFDKVTSISGVLFPLPKEERRAGIRRFASNQKIYSRKFVIS